MHIQPSTQPNQASNRILLVNDVPSSSRLLQKLLQQEGFRVIAVESSRDVLIQIEQSPPDLVIVNIESSEMDRYAVTRQIHQNTKLSFIPILLIAEHDYGVIRGLGAGVTTVVSKSIDPAELLARVQSFISLKRSIDKKFGAYQKQKEFVAYLAHDLRTPLLATVQLLQQIQQGTCGVTLSGIQPPLEQLISINQNLLDMVETLLEVHQYETGRKELAVFPVDLRELSREVVAELNSLANSKGLELRLAFIEGDDRTTLSSVVVRGDRLELRRLLTNLVNNAIRFTDRGTIEVRLTPSTSPDSSIARWITLEVKDTGIGIDLEEQATLFEQFRQGRTRREGQGLGLYLSRQIVEAHQGTIEVQSALNQGTIITVRLPAYRN
jgi:two-component system, sensor histidine kinase and response regulator